VPLAINFFDKVRNLTKKEAAQEERAYQQQILFNESVRVYCNQPRVFLMTGGKSGSQVHVAINRVSHWSSHQEGILVISDSDGKVLHNASFRSDKGGFILKRDMPGAQVVTLAISTTNTLGCLGGLYGYASSTSQVEVTISGGSLRPEVIVIAVVAFASAVIVAVAVWLRYGSCCFAAKHPKANRHTARR